MKWIFALIFCAVTVPAFAQQPVLVTNSGGVDYVQDAALTIATTAGPAAICRASATQPTAVSATNDAVLNWCDPSGAQYTNSRMVTTAVTTDSALTSYVASAASTNSTSVKGSAGNVYKISAINTTSTVYYLRMYNLASAPTCSSATGFVRSIPVPQAAGAGAGFVEISPYGTGYTTGIGYCLTGGAGSTDNTAAAVGSFITVEYK